MTRVVCNGTGPDNGLPMAVPHRMKRLRVMCGRGPSVCFRPCTVNRDAPLFPFNCKLDCAHCTRSGLELSRSEVPNSNGIAIDMSIGGYKSQSKRRVMRLCVHSLCDDIAQPIVRLGSFHQIGLTGNRAGAISFALRTSGLTFCGGSVS